jgi:Polyketide cyclase / dehydrase and lipid transport
VQVRVLSVIEIDRPRSEVAAFAIDPARAREWYGDVRDVRWNRQPVTVGSRLAFVAAFLGKEADYVYEVTELVPGERFAMTRAEGPFAMETVFRWEDAGGGGTRMTLQSSGHPRGLSLLLAPLLRSAMRRSSRRDLSRLKALLEAYPRQSSAQMGGV